MVNGLSCSEPNDLYSIHLFLHNKENSYDLP